MPSPMPAPLRVRASSSHWVPRRRYACLILRFPAAPTINFKTAALDRSATLPIKERKGAWRSAGRVACVPTSMTTDVRVSYPVVAPVEADDTRRAYLASAPVL